MMRWFSLPLILFLSAAAAEAYVRQMTPDGLPLFRDDTANIRYLVNDQTAAGLTNDDGGTIITAGSNPMAALQAAASRWNDAPDGNLTFAPLTTTPLGIDPMDGMNVIRGCPEDRRKSDSPGSRDRLRETQSLYKESRMKKRYQIRKQQQAVERFQSWAASRNEPIQLSFPTADVAELMQQSLGELLRSVGKLFIETVMEDEVEDLVGERSQPNDARQAYRWGRESGFCIIDGQRVPIDRPRVRSRQHNREIPLGSYMLFQKASLIEETVWHKIMHGLTMRHYKEVVQQFADAYGLEKSTTSEHFVRASRSKLEQLMKRSLEHVSLTAIVIDGTIFQGQHLIVAIGIERTGRKLVLGVRQGATENATVVRALLGELAERGVDFNQPRLYLVDGSKAIRAALYSYAGEAAFLQRCQVHKIRNVCEHLPQEQRPAMKFRMRAAYMKQEAADARQGLYKLHDELMEENPSAAGSLAEGLEETLTLLELGVTPRLRRSLASTNGIESGFAMVQEICRQVKRWQGSDHRLRWVGSALLFAESRWNRIRGYRHLPVLIKALEAAYRLRCNIQEAEAA